MEAKMTYETALAYILGHYGYGHQVMKLFEEMGELMTALCKNESRQAVTTEIADVEVMLEQIKMSLDIDTTDEKLKKVRRQICRINRGE